MLSSPMEAEIRNKEATMNRNKMTLVALVILVLGGLFFLAYRPSEIDSKPLEESLFDRLIECNSIKIIDSKTSKLLAQINDPKITEHVIDNIAFQEQKFGDIEMSPAVIRIVFLCGSTELASLGFVGKTKVRWIDGEWPGDAELTYESEAFIRAWIKENTNVDVRD
jgi:hypothetical protein